MKKIFISLGLVALALSVSSTSIAQECSSQSWSIGGGIGNNPDAKPICRRGCGSYQRKAASALKKVRTANGKVTTTAQRLTAAQTALVDDDSLKAAQANLVVKEEAFDKAVLDKETALADYIASNPGAGPSSDGYLKLEAKLDKKVTKAEKAVETANKRITTKKAALRKKLDRAETNAEKAAANFESLRKIYNDLVRDLNKCKDEYDDECDGPAWSIGGGISFW